MAGNAKDARPIRIAIVGGGCAGMAAAWHLSRQPNYEIHVFEQTWRLGGKGASVRASDGRILEHGLHIWLGFYENAFRIMDQCYAEVEAQNWGPEASVGRLVHGRIEDAFFPEPLVGVAGAGADGGWVAWSGLFPPTPGFPGQPLDEQSNPFTLASYMLRCFSLLKTLTLSIIGSPAADVPGGARPDQRSTVDEMRNLDFSADATTSLAVLIARMSKLLRVGALTGSAMLLQGVTLLERWLQQLNFAPQAADSALQLMEAVTAQVRKLLNDVVAVDPDIRTRTEIIDILLTIMVGLFRDRVLFNDDGLDSINDLDYREWLLHHGGTKSSVNSRFVRGAYDLVFAYQDGDTSKPRLAAGVALRGALRMFFTYRGSMFWRLRSGMGDAVFAPLYKVLQLAELKAADAPAKTSAVKFHFLHELRAVRIERADGEKDRRLFVSELEFAVHGDKDQLDQASANALDDNGCWPHARDARFGPAPAKPRFKTLKLRAGFDGVVLALGVDDFKIVCAAALSGAAPVLPASWTRMCDQVKTVATQAAQVWLNQDLEGLGWYRGSGLFTGLGLTFDTWADMTHTLAVERATPNRASSRLDEARSVAYFCAPLAEEKVRNVHGDAVLLERGVDDSLDKILKVGLRPIWPNAYADGATASPLEVLRHVQANFEGSERYTLSLPGSTSARISPLDRTVENMTIAGDWTACGLDAGCIEAAVMSGMLAAYAMSGQPDPAAIIGYDHP